MMLELFLNPSGNLPKYEHGARWMFFATRAVPAAYLELVCDPSLSVSLSPDGANTFLEKIQSPEYAEKKKRLEAECIEVAKAVVAEDITRVFSRNSQL